MAGRLGIGVVGVGALGRRHAENLAWRIPEARLVAVADVVPELARGVAEELAVPRWFASAEELAAEPAVEAVVIASNDEGHAAGIVAAAGQRKDVFCEKPITTTLAEADAALAAVAAAGVRLQIGFMRRYDAAYVAAKRHIDEGRIGSPLLFKAVHRNRLTPRPAMNLDAGGGADLRVFVGSAIHDYDNARWLLGDEVAAVHAVASRMADADPAAPGVDVALSTLHFAGGGLGNVENVSAARYAYDVRTEVVGTRGTVFIGSSRQTACLLATEEGISHDAPDHWLTRFGETYLIELTDWVRRTRAGESPFVTGADGRAALAIADGAVRSVREGQTIRLR